MQGNQIPNPFYVKIIEGLSSLETEVKNLNDKFDIRIKHLVEVSKHETLKREVALQRWVLAGFFAALLTMAGWMFAIAGRMKGAI